MSELKEKVILEIKKIYDPEIPVNIYELGLIYNIEIDEKNKVNIDMTLTDNVEKLDGVSGVDLNLVWDPPWDKDKMSEACKLELNL
jgi:metal-sulfur cluster biosynthetic enzyme